MEESSSDSSAEESAGEAEERDSDATSAYRSCSEAELSANNTAEVVQVEAVVQSEQDMENVQEISVQADQSDQEERKPQKLVFISSSSSEHSPPKSFHPEEAQDPSQTSRGLAFV